MRISATVRLLVGLFLLLIIPARAAVVYVNKNAAGAVHDGKTWGTAFTTVQAAVNAAKSGDEAWVAQGTYVENVTLTDGIALYGGFSGSETARIQRHWKSNVTILDGIGRIAYAYYAVKLAGHGAVFDGFSVRNGGDGVYTNDDATIANCTISGNTIAVFVYGGTASVINCSVRDNTHGITIVVGMAAISNCALSGGSFDGVFVSGGCGATIDHCSIEGFNSGVTAHGVVAMANCIVSGNSNDGIYVAGEGTIANCTITGNSFGIAALDTTVPMLVSNCVVAFNETGLYRAPTAASVISAHSDVYGNKSGNYTYIADQTGTNGNISADPLFVNRANGDYHPKAQSPCIDAGDDSVVTTGETDLDGNARIIGVHVDIGAYELAPTTSITTNSSLSAVPTAVEGVIYAGGDNGKLYAFTSPGLAPVAGFPVDISAAVGTPVKLNTRPAVYYGKTGKAIYLTTNLGHVVKVWPDGVVAWFTKPLNGPTMSTPAVTPDGNVYVDLGLGTSSVASYLFKLDEVSGVAKYISPYLGSSPAGALLDRSAAIDQRYAYVNASGDGLGSLAVLNQDNLVVRSSFAPGEDALAPFLNGRNIYVATKAGSVYKVNGITMSPDLAFGTLGRVQMGEGVTAGPFLDAGGVVYVGTASGKVWKLDGITGAKTLFMDSATNSAVTGLLVTRNVLAFGTANGTLEQVSLTDSLSKSVEALSGPPAGGPVYDPVQNRLIIATTSGQVYSVPGM